MLGYNKNYIISALDYILKNSKGTTTLEINRSNKNNNIE